MQIPQEALDQMKKEGWATMEEQLAYWKTHDHGGNILPDRVQSNEDEYSEAVAIMQEGDGPEYQTLGEYQTDAERNA